MKQTTLTRFTEKFVDKEPDQTARSHKYQCNWFIKEDTPMRDILNFIDEELALRDQELLEKISGMKEMYEPAYGDENKAYVAALTDVSEVVRNKTV